MADELDKKTTVTPTTTPQARDTDETTATNDVSRRKLLTGLAATGVGALAAVGVAKSAVRPDDAKKKIMARIHQELQQHDYLNDPLGYDRSTHEKYVVS